MKCFIKNRKENKKAVQNNQIDFTKQNIDDNYGLWVNDQIDRFIDDHYMSKELARVLAIVSANVKTANELTGLDLDAYRKLHDRLIQRIPIITLTKKEFNNDGKCVVCPTVSYNKENETVYESNVKCYVIDEPHMTVFPMKASVTSSFVPFVNEIANLSLPYTPNRLKAYFKVKVNPDNLNLEIWKLIRIDGFDRFIPDMEYYITTYNNKDAKHISREEGRKLWKEYE